MPNRKPYNIGVFFAIATGLIAVSPAWAFDDDRTINRIILDKENFLDIKAYQPRKSLDYQWYDSTNGARIFGGSLDHNHLYLLTAYKFQSDLSPYVTTRIRADQEVFYAIKPFPLPLLEIEAFPLADKPLGISLLGTTAYDKRQADLGAAVTWGRQPWNFTRFTWLKVDAMYNRKNDFDQSHYAHDPATVQWEGAYRIHNKHMVRYSLSRDSSLELIIPETTGQFRQKGIRYHLLYDYKIDQQHIAGVTLRGFEEQKSLNQTAQNQNQDTVFTSYDVYWADLDHDWERRVGVQFDRINNGFNDKLDSANSIEYSLDTLQLYGTQRLPFGPHMAWDFGLHLARALEKKKYQPVNHSPSTENERNESFQGKFRSGFEYYSADRKSLLMLNISLELDNFLQSPLNGGAAAFQRIF